MWQIRIYGTNEIINQKTPLKSTLEGLSDIIWQDFNVLGLWGNIEQEGEETTYFNGLVLKKPILRNSFLIKTVPQNFDNTHLDQFLYENLFSKRYHYLDFGDFAYRVSYCPSNQALWIVITELTLENNKGLRTISIKAKEAMPYGS